MTTTANKPRKLTTTEKRAKAMCEAIKNGEHGGYITVEWKRSAMYGHNPSITFMGDKVTNVSGCGYCKHSTALAESLRFLGATDEEQSAVWRTAGAGVSSIVKALESIGWKLEGIASSASSDSYRISKI